MGNKKDRSYTRGIQPGGQRSAGDCVKLSFDAELVNQQPGLDKVKVGEFMKIRLSGKIIQCYNSASDHCGDVSSALNGQLISCLTNEYYFKAKLLNRKGSIKVLNGK